jgi:hypothetical protein
MSMHAIVTIALAAAAFAVGLTFQGSAPGAIAAAGFAAVGWMFAAYSLHRTGELKLRQDALCDHVRDLARQKQELEDHLASRRLRRLEGALRGVPTARKAVAV